MKIFLPDNSVSEYLQQYSVQSSDGMLHLPGELKARTLVKVQGRRHLMLDKANEYGASNVFFIVDYVSTELARWCVEHHLFFVDGAGNAYVKTSDIFVWVEGRKKATTVARPQHNRAFTKTGARVLFVLLANPNLVSAPMQDIAQAAYVSLGTVAAVFKDLESEHYVVGRGKNRRLTKVKELEERWVEAYRMNLSPSLKERRVAGLEPYEWRQEIPQGMQLGGENALAAKNLGIAPETTTFYGDFPWKEITQQYRLRPHANGNTVLRERFWNPEFLKGFQLVPDLLIYADSVASADDRQLEIGQQMWRNREEF